MFQEYTFRPHGLGRFLIAAFLLFWLSGWAGGEIFVTAILGKGIYALVNHQPLFSASAPLELGPALAIGAFLLVWLSLWTIGGLAAIRYLLQMVWSKDRIAVEGDKLLSVHHLGPFRSTRSYALSDIRRIFVREFKVAPHGLTIQVGAELVGLSDLGTLDERAEAARQLSQTLGLPDEDTGPESVALPDEWQEAYSSSGERLLIPNPKTRHKQALIVSVWALIALTGAVLLAMKSLENSNLWAFTAIVTLVASWLLKKALWFYRGRMEWRIGRNQLIYQRRYRDKVSRQIVVRGLELEESTDSDSDCWYELSGVNLSHSDYAPFKKQKKLPKKISIDRTIHDPTTGRNLGLWLSRESGVPFADKIPTDEARYEEMTKFREKLNNSGKFGRFAARMLDGRLPQKPDPH